MPYPRPLSPRSRRQADLGEEPSATSATVVETGVEQPGFIQIPGLLLEAGNE